MLTAPEFLDRLHAGGTTFLSGTPCSYLKPLINAASGDSRFLFRQAANEGDAVAMAAGAVLAGRRAAVMFQNSGLGNAVNALTSLCHPFRVPILLMVTRRGAPDGPHDEPQHALMGEITPKLLDTLGIPWAAFPSSVPEADAVLALAATVRDRPFALVMGANDLAPHPLAARPDGEPIGVRTCLFSETLARPYAERALRGDALRAVRAHRRPDEVLIATTGYTGRELYALGDEPFNFYMVGSMGSASSFGLGLALCRPERPVTVIDGDAAVLMRMGNLATIGAHAPPSLAHLVLDNESNESTGGQPTVSRGVALGAVAQACGYRSVVSTDDTAELGRALASGRVGGPLFVHFRIRCGVPQDLPRPRESPAEIFQRLRAWLDVG